MPSFGDAGQVFDPFVYLGALSVATERIALGMTSIVLPLRHPAQVAKAVATVDQMSNGGCFWAWRRATVLRNIRPLI